MLYKIFVLTLSQTMSQLHLTSGLLILLYSLTPLILTHEPYHCIYAM